VVRPEHFAAPEFVTGFKAAATSEVLVRESETLGGTSLLHFDVDARAVGVHDDDGADAPFSFGSSPASVTAAVDARTLLRRQERRGHRLSDDR
jgi:hypothetical protein